MGLFCKLLAKMTIDINSENHSDNSLSDRKAQLCYHYSCYSLNSIVVMHGIYSFFVLNSVKDRKVLRDTPYSFLFCPHLYFIVVHLARCAFQRDSPKSSGITTSTGTGTP